MDPQTPPSPKRAYGSSYADLSTTVQPSISGPPVSAPGGRGDDGRRESNGGRRPYEVEVPPSQKLPYRPLQQASYLPSAMGSVPLTQVPPQPTQSTTGSAAGSASASAYQIRLPVLTQSPKPMTTTTTVVTTTGSKADLRVARGRAEAAIERLIVLQQQYRQHLEYGAGAANVPNTTAAAVQAELRMQTGTVLAQLREVRHAVALMAHEAENHRFRRWLVGGLLASFIPLVRRLFRMRREDRRSSRSSASAAAKAVTVATTASSATALALQKGTQWAVTTRDGTYLVNAANATQAANMVHFGGVGAGAGPALAVRAAHSAARTAANNTEYAFARSRALVDRIKGSMTLRKGGLASMAFFVFAVLYVFTNEVTLRVARTIQKRLKRLSAKLQRGDEPLNEADLKLLDGWRWRVLLWGRK